MLQHHNVNRVNIVLLILTILNLCSTLAIIVIAIIYQFYGFGINYTSQTYCNTYLIIKYETYKQQQYSARFVFMNLTAAIFIIQVIVLSRKYIQNKNKGKEEQDNQYWTMKQLSQLYIGFSLATMSILPILITYLSFFMEVRPCLNKSQFNWYIIVSISGLIQILNLVILILITKECDKLNQHDANNQNKNDIKQKSVLSYINEQYVLNNIFMKQASEHYKSIKQEVTGQFDHPLLNTMNNNISSENREYFEQKINIYNEKLKKNDNQERQNKKVVYSPVKQKQQKLKVSKKRTLIQKYKAKFREINPYKIQNKNKQQESQQMYDIPQEQYRIKNYHKSYNQLIKENKRPIRMPTHILQPIQSKIQEQGQQGEQYDSVNPLIGQQSQFINQPIKQQVAMELNNQESPSRNDPNNQSNAATALGLEASIIKGGIHNKFDEIVFKNPQDEQKRRKKLKRRIAQSQLKQAQLFYHKPGTNIILSKPRKKLFEQSETTKDTPHQQKQAIINKLKIAKQIQYKNELMQKQKYKQNQTSKILTKSQKLMQFLRSKYNYQKQKQINIEDKQHSFHYSQF